MGNAVICAMDGTNATVARKRVVIISVSLGSWVCDDMPQRMTANVGGAGNRGSRLLSASQSGIFDSQALKATEPGPFGPICERALTGL